MGKLQVCYVHGLDRRRINPADAPHLSAMLAAAPTLPLDGIPTNELLSTVLSGVYPHVHGVWQVSRREAPRQTWGDRLLSALPDRLGTSYQCIRYMLNARYELPSVERQRRRRFTMHRYKYTKRCNDRREMDQVGGVQTVLGLLGGRARHAFSKDFRTLARHLPRLGRGDVDLDFYETYAIDLFQHWNYGHEAELTAKLGVIDRFVADLDRQCAESGVTLMLISDHGQERVRQSIDLKAMLRKLGLPRDEWLFYMESHCCRFWFQTDRARRAVMELLASIEGVHPLTYQQMQAYHLCFTDDRYGEIYAFTDHGVVFFPDDFHHPLATLYMGLTEFPTMRRRLLSPVLRGNHGNLPGHPSEEGFVTLRGGGARTATVDRMELIDAAPTMLALLGEPTPAWMTGRVAWAPVS